MSRIGRKPITVPAGVEITISDNNEKKEKHKHTYISANEAYAILSV